jgi:ubiquinone/menaquinone biosynthesis C-methylase UbiE
MQDADIDDDGMKAEVVAMSEGRSRGFTAGSIPEAYDRFMSPQLFEPWARQLVGRAELVPGSSVLDVATGPGTVARLAASAVGPHGRVVASDISAAMLAVAASKPVDSAWARIEYLECSATAIEASESSFDAVLCQQGLQFFPDRTGAVQEMRRVTRRHGIVLVSTWASERPLGLIGPMTEVLKEVGMDEPYPDAFDAPSYSISAAELRRLLSQSGLREVIVETVELDAVWRNEDDAVATLMGTPYAPGVKALPPDVQQRIRDLLADRLGPAPDGTVTVRTTSHIGRGVR